MGHLGFVPRKSTWVGRTRAVGKEVDEALALWRKVRRLEDAGAFAVEAELVPAPLLAAITKDTGLVTVSLGSGNAGDVVFLFAADICGDGDRLPRHARAWGDLASLRRQITEERRRALTAFRADVATAAYPAPAESVSLAPDTLDEIIRRRPPSP
jgi:3-methyl-2-oxobutanoate hydroxymethyltransferase